LTRKRARRAAGHQAHRKPARRLQFPARRAADAAPAAALPTVAKNRWWGLVTPRGLPVLYGDKDMAEEDRDTDERLALFEVVEVTPSDTRK
jgi:hypothetical protein